MKMKEFTSNVLKVVLFGSLVLIVSSFFTKELSADDSEGQGLIEQFGDQLKKLLDLYKDGVITGYEYEREKKKLLK